MSVQHAKDYTDLSEEFLGNEAALLDLDKLADEMLASDLDPNRLAIQTRDLAKVPNVIRWVRGKEYLKINPFPRQYEVLTKLFECFCPHCSDMDVVNDMWGLSLDEIESKVAILEHGVCPHCKKTKSDFRNEGLINDYHELVGVAGQRCLDPKTEIVKMDGSVVRLDEVKKGDWLAPSDPLDRTPAIVKEVIGSIQPGYFEITFDDGTQAPICSDSHQWVVIGDSVSFIYDTPAVRPAAELKIGDYIQSWDVKFRKIVDIKKRKSTVKLIDLEIYEHKTFQAKSGLVLHNSGKTAITSFIATYILQQYISMGEMPYDYFGLTATTLRGTFVATSKGQAGETIWQNFLDNYDNCAWFKEYVEVLQEEEYQTGETLYRRLGESIYFRNKAVALTFEAANPARLRGRTRFFAAIDELGWFQSGEGYVNSGQENYASLNNSLRTIRSATNRRLDRGDADPLKGWMFNISSPQSEDDPIMPLLEKAKIDKTTFAFHYATWEINPTITKEDLKSEMLADPVKFWRDFGAIPPTASNAFIAQPESVNLLCGERPNAIEYIFEQFTKTLGTSVYRYITPKITYMKPHSVSYPRVMAIDAGETDNSYSFSIGYYDFERGRAVTEAICEIEPSVTNDGKVVAVSFERISDILRNTLAVPFNVVYFVADRWNSTSTLEQVRDSGIEAWKHSPKMPEFKLLRSRIYAQEVEIPMLDAEPTVKHPPIDAPIARLVLQTKTVRDGGNKLLKPARGSDDSFRGWALLQIILEEEKDNLKEIWEYQQANKKGGKKKGFTQIFRRISGSQVKTGAGRGGVTKSSRVAGVRRLSSGKRR